MFFSRCYLFLLTCALLVTHQAFADSDVTITDHWVRPSAPGQDVGAAYMTLTSKRDLSLVKVESAVAGEIEIHKMTMNKGVMKMRMLSSLDLKAGVPTVLAPGGYHLMLFDLRKPLKEEDIVLLTLYFRDGKGKLSTAIVNSKVEKRDD